MIVAQSHRRHLPVRDRFEKFRLNKPATSPSNTQMKIHFPRLTAATLAACIASLVGCYPAYPPHAYYNSAYNQDSKGYSVPQQPVPQGQPPPRYVVDPALVVAGVAAAGILGYAIGNNHGYYHGPYYGRGYYPPPCYH